ncbi:MAG: LD-carboxypeptidase [Acidobacteriaceae bacterium]
MLKPAAVSKGARVAVIAPASSARHEMIEQGMAALRERGYETEPGEHALGKRAPYFSGSRAERLADLHAAFADPEVRAIFTTRGGYGSNYLLEGLDLDLVRANPKPLISYSDLTAVQTWLLDEVGLPAFHGPLVAGDFSREGGVHDASLSAALGGGRVEAGPEEGLRILKPGRASGVLYGGCLSILTASLGTRFAPQTEGKLLFVEDVGAKPYQIDRMLRQMILAGKLDSVSGIVFGEMLDCASPGTAPDFLDQVILGVLDWFEGPIGIGLRSGHVSRANVTLPFGVRAELVLEEEPRLRCLEPAVEG